MLNIIRMSDGIEFALRVAPGSSRRAVKGVHGEALKISVQAPPEQGRANEEVIEVLAEWLEIPERLIQITAGMASRNKRVRIIGVLPAQVQQRL